MIVELAQIPDDEELLVGGFNITENFDLVKRRWRRQSFGKVNLSKYVSWLERFIWGQEETDLYLTNEQLGGQIFCARVHGTQCQLLATVDAITPMGLYYSKQRKSLFCSCAHWLTEIRGGRIVNNHSNALFNNLRGIAVSFRDCGESVFVASSGVDAILEVDLNDTELTLWDWIATENGYSLCQNGEVRVVSRDVIHQEIEYPTPLHTTHVNSVLQLNENSLLATLFHQGELIKIDMQSKKAQVILRGLRRPHGIRQMKNGRYMVANTAGGSVLILDETLNVQHVIAKQFNWIQDACELNDGSVLIFDADHHRLIRVDHNDTVLWTWDYGTTKRAGGLLPLPAFACKQIFLPLRRE